MEWIGFLGTITCLALLIKRKGKKHVILICGGISLLLFIAGVIIDDRPSQEEGASNPRNIPVAATPGPTPEPTLTPTPEPTVAPQPTPQTLGKVVNVKDNVNVRLSASKDGEILGQANLNEEFIVYTTTEDWVKIDFHGQEGYISADYIKVYSAYAEVDGETPMLTLDQFKELAETPSYKDLNRYPEKYKTAPIKVTVRVKDIEVDKLFGLLEGGYLCTLDGNDLVVRDARSVKEPKLLKGDRVTIYGYGGDLSVMQRKQSGAIFDKVIDEWYIPTVLIEYAEIK